MSSVLFFKLTFSTQIFYKQRGQMQMREAENVFLSWQNICK